MASPAEILRSCLIDLKLVQLPGIATLPGTPTLPDTLIGKSPVWCFVSSQPDSAEPDDAYDVALTIYDTVGLFQGREMRGGRKHTFPGVKLILRSIDYTYGYDRMNAIAVALDQQIYYTTTVAPEDKKPHYVASITRTTPIVALGEEPGRRRQLFSTNARITFQDREGSLG
jgi:hypothetical protein